MKFIETKTILTKVKYVNMWYGIDYNMNLYRGCCHVGGIMKLCKLSKKFKNTLLSVYFFHDIIFI